MESKNRRDLIVLAMVGAVFFISVLILNGVSPTYSSPDETANAFFAQTFASQSRLYSFEPLNSVLGDVLFPRSVISLAGRLVPVSFLGAPIIFGILIRLFGFWSLGLWTPVFALLAVFAWYGIFRKIFDRQVGLWSALLLFIHPAWWYWSSRPLMSNVAFVAFMIFCTFFLIVRPWQFLRKNLLWLDFVLAGVCLAISVWFRSFGILWFSPLLLVGIFLFRKYFSWKMLILGAVVFLLALTPVLYFNNSLYGAPWKTGYTVEVPVFSETSEIIQAPLIESASELPEFVLPFGFHPRTAARNILNYGLLMFWWLTIPAAVGFVLLLLEKNKKYHSRNYFYAAALVFSAIWFGTIYGSWTIHDNPGLSAVTIVNSYTRYWLPVFVLTTPLVALVLVKLGVQVKKFGGLIIVSIFVLITALSFNVVFLSSADALWPMRTRLVEAATIHDRLLAITETESVIIVDRGDKYFFPERRVRYPLRDETTYALMPKIVEQVPLYYFGITFPEVDMEYLNGEKLKGLGLKIEFIENFGEESLYRILKAE